MEYFADLNPRYPARNERRYAVFLRKSKTERAQTYLRYSTRQAAERAAAKLTQQEKELDHA